MEKFLNKKGITLIALVITIVVLIILAGVIISITLGNNGIINKAKIAGQEYTNAKGYEEMQVAKIANEIDGYVDGNRDLASETPGTATASDIAKGKTAWVNGNKLTGTAPEIYYVGVLNVPTGNNGLVNTQFDISEIYNGYASLTLDDFVFKIDELYDHWNAKPGVIGGNTLTRSYNQSTGILSINGSYGIVNFRGGISGSVYLIPGISNIN